MGDHEAETILAEKGVTDVSGKTSSSPRYWKTQPFYRFNEYMVEIDRVLHLSMEGLSLITRSPQLTEALINYRVVKDGADSMSPEEERDLKSTRTKAKYAQDEISKGFPIFHAHAVTSIWSALDALIFDFVCVWILNVPSALASDPFSKIKITLSQYELLGKEDRISYLVKELSRSLNADFKLGIGKYEALLTSIGLGGEVDADIQKTLLEMSQVRNVLVHRAGLVDRRFKEVCPWVDIEIGTPIRIENAKYHAYLKAIEDYAICIINRMRKLDGLEPYIKEAKEEEPSDNGA